jgi:hypothetical protein
MAQLSGLTQAQLEEIIKPQSSIEGMRVWVAVFGIARRTFVLFVTRSVRCWPTLR